jgi:hypothetical protein
MVFDRRRRRAKSAPLTASRLREEEASIGRMLRIRLESSTALRAELAPAPGFAKARHAMRLFIRRRRSVLPLKRTKLTLRIASRHPRIPGSRGSNPTCVRPPTPVRLRLVSPDRREGLVSPADILFLKTTIRAMNNGPGVRRACEGDFDSVAERGKSRRRGGKERKKRKWVSPSFP